MSSRETAEKLNSEAIAAANQGDASRACEKWTKAADADPAYASPLFNMAHFLVTRSTFSLRDAKVVHELLERAEALTSASESHEDASVRKQLERERATLQARLLTPGTRVKYRSPDGWSTGKVQSGRGVFDSDTGRTSPGPPVIGFDDGTNFEGPFDVLCEAIEHGELVIEDRTPYSDLT